MNKIKEFLSKVEKEDKELYFKLYKFYKNPKLSLGGSEESTIDKYYEYGDIKSFVLNNTFFEFLELCMKDNDFDEKLEINLLRKIRFILYDSREFVEEYFEALEDPYLRDWCKNKTQLNQTYHEKYDYRELFGIQRRYEKHGWLYDLNVGKEKIKNLNLQLIGELLFDNTWRTEVYKERYIQPEEDRKYLFLRIKTDDYTENDDCFLARGMYDRKTFSNLVCDNEFLKILEEEIINKELTELVRNNIIEILEMSINFKTLNIEYEDFWIHYNRLENKIKEYDYHKAEELIKIFKSKKQPKENQKIIKLENYANKRSSV